jgi:hypothetical protein
VEDHVPHNAQHFAKAFALDRLVISEMPFYLTRGFRSDGDLRRGICIGHEGMTPEKPRDSRVSALGR